MKSRVLNILALLFNIAIVVLSAIGLWQGYYESNGIGFLRYFTNLSGGFIGLAGLLFIPSLLINVAKKECLTPMWIRIVKLMATASITLTLVTVLAYLGPTYGYGAMLGGTRCILHLVLPVVAIVSFIFFECEFKIKWRYTFLGMVPALIYGVVYITMVLLKKWDDFYSLLTYYPGLAISIMIVGVYGLALVLWLLSKLLNLIIFGYVYDEKDEKEEIQDYSKTIDVDNGAFAPDNEKISTIKCPKCGYENPLDATACFNCGTELVEPSIPAKSKSVRKTVNVDNKYNDSARTYHISRQKLVGKWQVKLANGEKAIKLFNTQLEAINYAKALVKTQGGSIRIHSMKGRLRK